MSLIATNIVDMTYFLAILLSASVTAEALNVRPIIGILSQETKTQGKAYIPSAYVKYIEMAGARALPIRIYQSDKYYEFIFNRINGVLFPGGGVNILTSGYAKAAQILYRLAKKSNDRGDYFPMWGTCLGFELMTALTTGKNMTLWCDGMRYSLPLNLEKDYKDSRLLKDAPTTVVDILKNKNVTGNFHFYCLTAETFRRDNDLNTFYRVISTNLDRRGLKFISTFEAYEYPFYGSQWHPEKNVFNWNTNYTFLDRTLDGVMVSQYFANFFVQEARKSSHKFETEEEASKYLFENFQPEFKRAPSFEDYYYFLL